MSALAVQEVVPALARVLARGWLVGGAVRDRLLDRPTSDFDVAVEGDPREPATRFARASGGHAFSLSDGFGGWRVVARDRSWQVDLLPLAGESIEYDLAQRDLTINAIAEPLPGGAHLDPFGGIGDLARRRLRMVSPVAFDADPLRVMRLARLACELNFIPESETVTAARARAERLAAVAPERVFAELRRIIASQRALEGVALMDSLRATKVVLPELDALHGIEQSRYHHLDVYEHTVEVLRSVIELEREPERWLGLRAREVARELSRPLANELTRWQALRLGALLHDIAKPQTRGTTAEGRVTFIGHDAAGAQVARGVLIRLRAAERLREYVAALARHHLRLGFLVHQMPLDRRTVYRYLRACEPVGLDVTVLSVADRVATRGRGSEEAIAKHLRLAEGLLDDALEWLGRPPRPPLRGDELADALGIEPGPELGRLLAALEEAAFAGEVDSAQDAIHRARELLAADQ